jgi:hypothetical protein
MPYTYYFIEPSTRTPFKKKLRRTRGEYIKTTEPMGCFGFRYAIFRNRASDVLIPTHDLTKETKAAIDAIDSTREYAKTLVDAAVPRAIGEFRWSGGSDGVGR